MPLQLDLNLRGDGAWKDLPPAEIIDIPSEGEPLRVAYLSKGMSGGAPSVGMLVTLPDGRRVFFQTSARLFVLAGAAIKGAAAREGFEF
jgi:hypothetical protein